MLNEDVLLIILEYVKIEDLESHSSTMLTCLLVSKQWYELALPIYWRAIDNSTMVYLLAKSPIRNKLVEYVQKIVTMWPLEKIDADALDTFIETQKDHLSIFFATSKQASQGLFEHTVGKAGPKLSKENYL